MNHGYPQQYAHVSSAIRPHRQYTAQTHVSHTPKVESDVSGTEHNPNVPSPIIIKCLERLVSLIFHHHFNADDEEFYRIVTVAASTKDHRDILRTMDELHWIAKLVCEIYPALHPADSVAPAASSSTYDTSHPQPMSITNDGISYSPY